MSARSSIQTPRSLVLVIDTCADIASVALCDGEERHREITLAERTASVGLLGAIDELLRSEGVAMRELSGIGVVNGPGSFTGVRVGLATAKGLCEATGAPLAPVSRLAVLATAAQLADGYAVLRAGRGELFVRDVRAGEAFGEWLSPIENVVGMAQDRELVFAEAALTEPLASVPQARLVVLSAVNALELVQQCLRDGGIDSARVDANYVRNEEAIYARQLAGR